VPPLAAPEATSLFCERAQLEATEEISKLCARLDSLPLAVELAAARTNALSPAQILERLSQRLDLLRAGRDADPRHQTLRATIEWSYGLLSERGRQLFARFSVFAGGCTLEAAEEVADADLDTLQSLVEKSLIRHTNERYWMLETIREYAAERLEEHSDAAERPRKHAEYFTRVAESLGLVVESYEAGRPAQYDVAAVEQDNFRAAIDWSRAADPELGLRISVALEQFWVAHNPYEGIRTLEPLVAAADGVPLELQARALRCLGGCLTIIGDLDRASPNYVQSLDLYERIGDDWGTVHLRHRLATSALARDDWARGRALLEENLVRARALGSRYLEGEAMSALGLVEDHDGNVEHALDLIGQSLEIARAVGFRWRESIDLGNLAHLSVKVGRLSQAEEYARAGLELSRDMDDRLTTVGSLGELALIARARGDVMRAGCLWGAIEAEELRGPLGRWTQYRDEVAAPLRELDSASEFELGRHEGRAMSLDQAVEYALASID
jgi:non-specific serine/threonine protein kinase